MRTALNPNNGALTDLDAEMGEREAMSALFAGVLSSAKPQSWRQGVIPPGARASPRVRLSAATGSRSISSSDRHHCSNFLNK
jgi:hypothetical protein